MAEKGYPLSPPTNSNSQNFSETFDEKLRHDIVKGMDQLHVIIKLPFKRPEKLKPINTESWTEEKEKRLFRYLEDTPKDALNWDKASEILNFSKENLFKRIENLSLDKALSPKEIETVGRAIINDQDGQVLMLQAAAQEDITQGTSIENINEILMLNQQLSTLEIKKGSRSSKSNAATNEASETPSPEKGHALEDETPLSGMSSPFSNISDGSIEHRSSEDYISQLKQSAMSLFK